MKNVMIILMVIFMSAALSSITYSQQKKKDTNKNIPAAVLNSFKKAYPKAVIKSSGKETEKGKTYYELETMDGEVKRDLLYQPDGKLVEIEEQISHKDLPQAVKKTLVKEFPEGQIKSAERVTKDGKDNYEVIIRKDKKSSEVLFDKDGKILSNENEDSDEKDDDEN